MAHSSGHAAEQHGLNPRQYLLIGLALTIITLVELWVSYSGMPYGLLVGTLMILSAVKFVVVVAYFMHLRFESGLMTKVFAGSFVLAALIMLALLAIFWGDLATGIRANRIPPGEIAPPPPASAPAKAH